MLEGVSPLISQELLGVLSRMEHGGKNKETAYFKSINGPAILGLTLSANP